MNDKRQLLCTFSNVTDYKSLVDQVFKFYKIHNHCIFVFYNIKNVKELFLTYNVLDGNGLPKFPNTISIHRKKNTNTLYTLNAMNQIIRDENGGVFDNKFQIDWQLYQDSLILTNDDFIRIISIKIYDIIN